MNDDMKKERSPSYPKMPLSDALELAKRLHSKAGRAQIRPEVAIGPLGYTSMNGAALGTISTLAQYGLVDRERAGGLAISPLALRLFHPLSPEQEATAKREAALKPRIFSEIFQGGYHDCSEDVLANHLIQSEFTADGAKRAAAVYRANAKFADLDEMPRSAPDAGTLGDASPSTNRQTDAAPAASRQPEVTPPVPASTSSTQLLPNELPIPLDDGRVARIPFPMSEETFDLLIGTLNLWKKRLLRDESKS